MLFAYVVLAAHMHTVIPDPEPMRKGRAIAASYLFCHPFEHEVEATAPPAAAFVVGPDGARHDIAGTAEKAGETFRLSFTPPERGDYYLVVRAPDERLQGATAGGGGRSSTVVRAAAKCILHVQSQVGWDRPLERGLDIVPLTRPYGLRPGVAFRARVVLDGTPVAGCEVEIERYNAAPPKTLPPDEFVTAVVKTDAQGIFVATLPEAGWWGLAASVVAAEGEAGSDVKHVLVSWVPVGGT
jgi:cobalt/nickel transport protein